MVWVRIWLIDEMQRSPGTIFFGSTGSSVSEVSIRSRYNGCCPQGMAGRIEVFQRQSQGEDGKATPLGGPKKRRYK